MKTLYTIFSIFILTTGPLTACQFDTDCGPGNTCMKNGFDMDGVCGGGLNPGNSFDQNPIHTGGYNDINGTRGNTCNLDTDCGPGNQCVKGYGIMGVCQ